MRRLVSMLVLAYVVTALPAAAQTAVDPEQQQRLAHQKLRLVEMLLNAPAAQPAAARDGDAGASIERSRGLLGEAREALAAQRPADAARALDEALRSLSRAGGSGTAGLSDSVQKQRLQDMSEQVATYRASLADLVPDAKNGAAARGALQRVDALADESRGLAGAGRLGDANRKMAESYKLAVEEISRLRAGEVVTISLRFNSPAEEYAHEQKRFQSNQILVNMMIAEGRAEGERRRMVDGFLQEAGRLKAEAANQTLNNNFKEAVTQMEKAFVQLNRALQAMGVPAF